MTLTVAPRLFPDRESAAAIPPCLHRNGFDLAHEMLRPDDLTSPFPNRGTLLPRLGRLDPALLLLIQLFTLGESMSPETVGELLAWICSKLGSRRGCLCPMSWNRDSTAGSARVLRLGQHSWYPPAGTSRVRSGVCRKLIWTGVEYPGELSACRAGSLPSAGRALDLCSGSGIAGQSLAATRRGLVWTGVDLAPLAVEAAVFDAMLNEVSDRYTPIIGDLYEPVAGQYFQLIVANPPSSRARYDRLSHLRRWWRGRAFSLAPMLEGLKAHLAPSGRAIIYGEGLGNERGPFVLDLLERIAASGLTIGMTLLSTKTIEQTLFSIGRTLAAQSPPRIEGSPSGMHFSSDLGSPATTVMSSKHGQESQRWSAVVRCDADPPAGFGRRIEYVAAFIAK